MCSILSSGFARLGARQSFADLSPTCPKTCHKDIAQAVGVDQSRHEQGKRLVAAPNQAFFLPKAGQSANRLGLAGVIRRSSDSWGHQGCGLQENDGHPARLPGAPTNT